MRVAAHLGVLDEVELIPRTIAHLRQIGVDHIMVLDLGSTDGTLDVLRSHTGPDLELVCMGKLDVWDEGDPTTERMIKGAPADWIIFLDADEFWIPKTGSLKECAVLDDADVIQVDRFNVPLGRGQALFPESLAPSRYDDLMLYVEPPPSYREQLKTSEVAFISGVPGPKVMARRDRIGSLIPGMHEIAGAEGQALRRRRAEDVVIAHLPFTTYSRFSRKVENVRQTMANHPDYFVEDIGWHWRRWVEQADRGHLFQEFRRQVVDADLLSELRGKGAIRSAAELFAVSP